MRKSTLFSAAAGTAAGAANGLFGAGGGMLLVPALDRWAGLEGSVLFPTSLAIMVPLCLTSLTVCSLRGGLPLAAAWPYLLGSALGGLIAGLWGRRVPVRWLRRALGLLILWGGVRSFL